MHRSHLNRFAFLINKRGGVLRWAGGCLLSTRFFLLLHRCCCDLAPAHHQKAFGHWVAAAERGGTTGFSSRYMRPAEGLIAKWDQNDDPCARLSQPHSTSPAGTVQAHRFPPERCPPPAYSVFRMVWIHNLELPMHGWPAGESARPDRPTSDLLFTS